MSAAILNNLTENKIHYALLNSVWCIIQLCRRKSSESSVGKTKSMSSYDSCCSVSLCSLEHVKLMQEKYPSFKWVKLPSPVAIDVANEDAGLQGVGMQDVRIDWGPGKYSIHTMLVVSKLSFPVRFGNNHLESCDAVVSRKERVVHFRHPAM